jgi:glyoxylase-like metal-dependent hydrolase (beta-lactamase superfamily II)
MQETTALGPGLRVLERGWLSSNNVLLAHGDGATLIDSGHCTHAAQTLALVAHALGPAARLSSVINTHLHADHCGGNAALQRDWQCAVLVPEAHLADVRAWDEDALSYRPLRQRCERFIASGSIRPGQMLAIGERQWHVIAAPGHDPRSVMLFDERHGVLVSADALWENGFGVVFPELEGESAFDDVGAVLDLIERLPVRWVVPGHGAPFADVAGALQRARSRLAGYHADPPRHARHAAKVLMKFHMLEEQQRSVAQLLDWATQTPLMQRIWQGLGGPQRNTGDWCAGLLDELVGSGALVVHGAEVSNR